MVFFPKISASYNSYNACKWKDYQNILILSILSSHHETQDEYILRGVLWQKKPDHLKTPPQGVGRGYDNPKSVTLNIKQGSQGQTACGSGVIKVKKIYLLGLILTVKGMFINKAFVHCKYTYPYHLISWFSSYTGKAIWLCALHSKEIRDPYHLITLFTTTSNTHTVIKCRLQVPISHFRVREDLEKRVQVVWRKKRKEVNLKKSHKNWIFATNSD